MKFYIETINDNGSGMEYSSKEAFLAELGAEIDDCIANGGTFFDVNVDSDVSVFYHEEEEELNLPTEANIEIDWLDCNINDEEEIKDAVIEYLTDEFGFCIFGAKIQIEEGLAIVTEIKWDTTD